MKDILNNVQNYDPSHPKLKKSVNTLRWSSLFIFDLIFGFSTRLKNERGQTLKKFQNNSRISKRLIKLHEATIEKMLQDNKDFTCTEPLPIPTIAPEHFDIETFKYWKSKVSMPLVIKNFLKDAPILDMVTVEQLIADHGDKNVKCVQPDFHLKKKEESSIGQNVFAATTTLKEFLTSEEYDSYYVNNFYGMLSNDDFLEYCKGNEIDGVQGQPNILNQWFISRVENNGSTLHCASGDNMFLNVKGRKEWIFIHPSYSPILQTSMSKHGTFCVSETDETFESDYYEFLLEKYPHFKHIPVYKVVLEEGDLLFNPPWWWHRVQNLAPLTVGCATRYYEVHRTIMNAPTYFLGMLIEMVKDPKKSPDYIARRAMKDKKYADKFLDSVFSKKENAAAEK